MAAQERDLTKEEKAALTDLVRAWSSPESSTDGTHLFRETGEEKSRDLITDEQMHLVWVARGNADVCGNPACQEPRRPDAGPWAFSFWGQALRCQWCVIYRREHNWEDSPDPKNGLTAVKHGQWISEGNEDLYGGCSKPRPDDSHLQGWLTAARCADCLSQTTAEDGWEWVAVHGDCCAICGGDRDFTHRMKGRCEKRRCGACLSFRQTYHRDKTPEEVSEGTLALHREWVANGHANECQECGAERDGGGKFYGYREKLCCSKCYHKERKARNRVK
ncbi:hypothetical protein FLONG3_3730 [Fusarium longipes]|uniref:Uncharacterized protein n=1 Tax=Fusarium longipes TaxID=694270 RepID=A0A395T0D9_9HYPO|nr:hypothetical protein FLONG3_3730 [Fusarium longipes]